MNSINNFLKLLISFEEIANSDILEVFLFSKSSLKDLKSENFKKPNNPYIYFNNFNEKYWEKAIDFSDFETLDGKTYWMKNDIETNHNVTKITNFNNLIKQNLNYFQNLNILWDEALKIKNKIDLNITRIDNIVIEDFNFIKNPLNSNFSKSLNQLENLKFNINKVFKPLYELLSLNLNSNIFYINKENLLKNLYFDQNCKIDVLKEKIFKSKNFLNFQIKKKILDQYSVEEFRSNKKLAFNHMLPAKQLLLKNMRTLIKNFDYHKMNQNKIFKKMMVDLVSDDLKNLKI